MNDWFDAEQHVERAHEFYEASRWEEAESELRRALELNPDRAEWHFNLGLTLEAAGRLEEAVVAYAEARRLEPDNAQTLMTLGVSHLRLEDPAAAVETLNEARRLDPSRPEPLVHLVEAYARLGEHEQAEVMFYMAMQLERVDQALAYSNLASSLMERGLVEKAMWCLREAAQLDPRLPRVHARLAEACARSGRADRARQLYLRELRNNPGDIDTLLDLGCLLVEMNRLGDAGEKFRRVLELESDNPDAHFYLGELALKQRRHADALAAFRLVMRLDPEHTDARRRAAEIQLRAGDIGEARRLLRKDLKLLQRDAQALDGEQMHELGALLLDAKLHADASRVFEAMIDRRPEDATALHHLSVARFQMGEREAGVRACRRAIRLRPDFVTAMHNLALAYMEQANWRRAQVWVRRALAIDPDDPSLRRLRTRLRVRAARQAGRRLFQAMRRWTPRAKRSPR